MTPPLLPWRTRSSRDLLHAPPWLRVSVETVELPSGQVVDDFYSLDMPDHAIIVALTHDNLVVTTRNYKHGPREVCLNLPAGYLEPGEDPLACAQRELLEEAGYQSDDWSFLGAFHVDGNRGAGRAYLYLARDARQVTQPNSGDLEEMQLELHTLADLLAALRRGETPVLGIAAALSLASLAIADSTDPSPPPSPSPSDPLTPDL